jgi:hypothetical protein
MHHLSTLGTPGRCPGWVVRLLFDQVTGQHLRDLIPRRQGNLFNVRDGQGFVALFQDFLDQLFNLCHDFRFSLLALDGHASISPGFHAHHSISFSPHFRMHPPRGSRGMSNAIEVN